MKVYVTHRGKVWHARRDCEWLEHARTMIVRIGRRSHPVRAISLASTRRKPCRVCGPEKI